MFKRIKNLLDISRYSVDQVVNPMQKKPDETTEQYYERTWGYTEEISSSTPHMPFRAATIVNMKEDDPFNHITNETPEQPLEDTTTGK